MKTVGRTRLSWEPSTRHGKTSITVHYVYKARGGGWCLKKTYLLTFDDDNVVRDHYEKL